MNKLLKVKCPQCDTVFPYYDSEFRPFCCERCKMIDLGHWFEESYKVAENEIQITDKVRNEKSVNEEKNNTGKEIQKSGEDSYEDYTPIDEESYDENDY